MANPQTVQLFLIDGTSIGRVKCTMSNWTGKVYSIPRTELARSSEDRPDLHTAGVYFLLGLDESTGQTQLYVGQAQARKSSKGVLGRIQEHVTSKNHDYFTHAIIILSGSDSFVLGATEISYLENGFVVLAQQAGRVEVKNAVEPTRGTVSEEKEAELDTFITNVRIAVGALGHHFLEPVTQPSPREFYGEHNAPKDVEPELWLRTANASGRGRQTNEGFVIYAGAQLNPIPTASTPAAALRDRQLHASRVNSQHELLKDTLFGTPSRAACFLTGSSVNGRVYWKNKQGESLAHLENKGVPSPQGLNTSESEVI